MRMLPAVLVLLVVPLAASADPSPSRQRELADLIAQDCGSCHGMTRKGGLGAPLTQDALKDLGDSALVATIMDGRPGTPMPPWRPLLSESDAEWMVKVLKGGAR